MTHDHPYQPTSTMNEELLKSLLRRVLSKSNDNIFKNLEQAIEDHFATLNSQDMDTLKKNKGVAKMKGDLFEHLCLVLLRMQPPVFRQRSLKDLKEVHLLKNVHFSVLNELALPRADRGIDIIAKTAGGKWIAIQCKYRKRPTKLRHTPQGFPIYHQVKFKDLSTFIALCTTTGPEPEGWYRRVVITNCQSVRRQGSAMQRSEEIAKEKKDLSICQKSFEGIDRGVWSALSGDQGHKCGNAKKEENSVDEALHNEPKPKDTVKEALHSEPNPTNPVKETLHSKPKTKTKSVKRESDATTARIKRQEWLNKLERGEFNI